MLQLSDHPVEPPLDSPQEVHILLMLGAPELDAVLRRVEGQNTLPCPAGHIAVNTNGFLGCKCIFLGHVQLYSDKNPNVLLRAALNQFFFTLYSCLGLP